MWLIILVVVILPLSIGILILVLAGVTFVEKGKVKVLERGGSFFKLVETGYHYFHPFLYQVVGVYNLGEQTASSKINDYFIEIKYKLIDPVAFHYAGHCFLEEMVEVLPNVTEPEEIKQIIFKLAENYSILVTGLEIAK